MSRHGRESSPPKLLRIVEQDLRDRVGELKDQLEKKDEQITTQNQTITSMLERDRETNILIQNLQQLLSVQQLGNGSADN